MRTSRWGDFIDFIPLLYWPYHIMRLPSASPRGGPRANVGEYGDFMGTLQQNFCSSGGGNVEIFECAILRENVGTSLLFN